MLIERNLGLLRLHFLIQFGISIALMITLYALLWVTVYQNQLPTDVYLRFMLVFSLGLLVEYFTRSEDRSNLYALSTRKRNILSQRQVFLPIALALVAMIFLKEFALSRVYLFLFFASFSAFVFWSNTALPPRLARWIFATQVSQPTPVLLISSHENAKRFRRRVRLGEFIGIRVAGYVDLNKTKTTDGAIRCLGSLGDLDTICQENNIGGIIVVNNHEHDEIILDISKFCDFQSIRFMVVDDLRWRFGRNFSSHTIGGTNMYVPMREPLENPLNQLMKRGLDMAIAFAAIVTVLPPCILLVWALQRKHSPGPLFFRQDRMGRNGKSFKIYKFRTMHLNPEQEGVQAKKGDARIYKGGGFLRRASIDELPQFINVLLGHMSVVGPRPHYIEHDEIFTNIAKNYPVRRFAKPGITGLAQIKGYRGEVMRDADIRNRVRWDIAYIRSWSVLLDIKIILLTFREAILPSERAY